MYLVDANLLIYASYEEASQHQAARTWLEERLNSGIRVGLPWVSLVAFVRLTTNPRVFERPLSNRQAADQVSAWLALPTVWTPTETPRHGELFRRFLIDGDAHGNLVPDAHLAALSVEHGLILCSTDRDFARFPGVRWQNPLENG